MNGSDNQNLCREIIGASFEVRKILGRFLYEEVYEEALHCELKLRGINSKRQVYLPVLYKGMTLDKSYRMDLVVENQICVELKTLESMGGKEVSQIISYLKFSNLKVGYLINFGASDFSLANNNFSSKLDKGIYRFVV